MLSSDQVLLIFLKCGFGCGLYASKSVSAPPLSSTTVARKCQRKRNSSYCKTLNPNWERTANPHELSTSMLFCGYRLWFQRIPHQYLSPWLKKLQCNQNSTLKNGMLLKRRGKHYCKADTKAGMKWEISTGENQDRIETKYAEPLCN